MPSSTLAQNLLWHCAVISQLRAVASPLTFSEEMWCSSHLSIYLVGHMNCLLFNSLARSSTLVMKRGLLTGIFSLPFCLDHFNSMLCTSLRSDLCNCLFFINPSFFKSTNYLNSVFHMVQIVELTKSNFQHTSASLFPPSILVVALNSSSTLNTFFAA